MYYDNVGDGVYDGSGTGTGLRVQQGGCFDHDSTSREIAVRSYIIANFCG